MSQRRWYQGLKASEGMTLIEIMVVVAIIGMITALVSVSVMSFLAEARIKSTNIQIDAFESALKQFKRVHGSYPTSEQGLEALVENPGSLKDYPEEGYLEELPLDAWGEEFIYRSPGESGHRYEIVSKGPDKEEGTEDDLTSYQQRKKED
ncbi:MAG: type II secretion system major pseudopilin GspG [Deltaproteobacteria bacterium]|nr:type II secretion system major pseudopilin GspG [Deltaproteobacteria bacterium]